MLFYENGYKIRHGFKRKERKLVWAEPHSRFTQGSPIKLSVRLKTVGPKDHGKKNGYQNNLVAEI